MWKTYAHSYGLDASTITHLGAAVFYAFISISTTFFNKAVLSVYDFQCKNFILLSQHIFTIGILHIMRSVKLIDFPNPQFHKCIELLPVSLLYSLNVGIALSALSHLNIPMYGALKRMTILFVLIGESIFLGKHSSSQIKQSVLVIVCGALVAGAGDLEFDFLGYVMALLSCLSQTAYLLYVAKTGAETGINSFGLLFYNSLLAIPFVLVIVLYTSELSTVLDYPRLGDNGFQLVLIANLVLGSLLNYSMFLCTTTNSALTTTVVGQVKNAVSLLLGFFLLGGVTVTFVNLVGLILNTLGGIWYAYIKYDEKKSQPKPKGAENC